MRRFCRFRRLVLKDPEEIYDSACFHAIAASACRAIKQPGDAAREDDRAMDLLKHAVSAGFKDAGVWKAGSDLDSLRDRADFKKLIADLERSNAQALIPK